MCEQVCEGQSKRVTNLRASEKELRDENRRLIAEVERLTVERHGWETGFVCGYVCAAANVIRTHDLPTVALDLLKEGIGRGDISAVDESDLETLVNSDSRIAAYLKRDKSASATEAVRP